MRLLPTLSLLLAAATAEAGLIKSDFQAPGDGYLVTDTATNLQWLSPVATRNQTYGNATIQNIENTYGFHYATYDQTAAMLTANFGSLADNYPGDAAGFAVASSFLNVFGVAENINCGGDNGIVPCPRTQGLTSDLGGYANSHLAIGMITFGSNGYLIANNSWPDNFAEGQVGSWLVRDAPTSAETPEPASVGLALAGAGMLLFLRRR